MRTYTWDDYYEKFYDWAESTRVKNLAYLESLGASDEVAEIIMELSENKSASVRLFRKAVEEKVKFTGDELLDLFLEDFDQELMIQAVKNSASILTQADIDDLYGYVDEDILLDICKKKRIPVPDIMKDEDEPVVLEEEIVHKETPRRGFFGKLGLVLIAVFSHANRRRKGKRKRW